MYKITNLCDSVYSIQICYKIRYFLNVQYIYLYQRKRHIEETSYVESKILHCIHRDSGN